jgi:hypothetical protein
MPVRHVDPDAGWPAEDIELLVCPGCRCGLARGVLWALRQILPPAGCVKTTTKTQGGALRWIND